MSERLSRPVEAIIKKTGKQEGIAYPKNYGGEAMKIEWGWNKAAFRDQVVKVTIGGKSAHVYVQELYQILKNT